MASNAQVPTRQMQIQANKERLQLLAILPTNRFCSECSEMEPTWASLLKAPVEGGQKLGVLCCYRCSSFHFQLGREVCTVQNIKMVEECK